MKRILALILSALIILSFASCAKDDTVKDINALVESDSNLNEELASDAASDADAEENEEETPAENKPTENKPVDNKPVENKPAENKPAENKPAENKPSENKPAENKPSENKPAENKPAENKPADNKPKTMGASVLADFKAKAASYTSTLSLAEALCKNEALTFSTATMEVVPGYLTGFGNKEIKGFKEGTMFGPVIGTIPFIGYVFSLEDASGAQAFISQLKQNANLGWNICNSADEMFTASVGNKVFFVMSPKVLEE